MKTKILAALALSALCISGHAGTVYRDRVMPVAGDTACLVELQPGFVVNSNMVITVMQNGTATRRRPDAWFPGSGFYETPAVVVKLAPNDLYKWPGTDAERADRYARITAAVNACKGK